MSLRRVLPWKKSGQRARQMNIRTRPNRIKPTPRMNTKPTPPMFPPLPYSGE